MVVHVAFSVTPKEKNTKKPININVFTIKIGA